MVLRLESGGVPRVGVEPSIEVEDVEEGRMEALASGLWKNGEEDRRSDGALLSWLSRLR